MNEQLSSAQSPEHGVPEIYQDTGAPSAAPTLPTPTAAGAPPPAQQPAAGGVIAGGWRWRILAEGRPWWQTARATYAALALILLLGGYFRFLALTDWDGGTGQHPDERFFAEVTALVRTPASLSEYFDSARSPANPRNGGKTFFVYGTFPTVLTRLVAVALTPAGALPETVPDVSGAPPTSGESPQVANPERAFAGLPLLRPLFNPDEHNLAGYGSVQKVGRVLVALFDLGSILMVFLIGVRLYDRRIGLLAALLAALAVMSIQQSHFYVDPIFSTFFTLVALYGAVRVAQGGSIWSYSLLGVSIGLAAANRITLVALAAVAIVAALQAALVGMNAGNAPALAAGGRQRGGSFGAFVDTFLRRDFPLLCLAGLLTLVTFRVAQPYAFIGSTPTSPPIAAVGGSAHGSLDWMQGWGFFDVRPDPRYIDNMQTVQRLVTGQDDFPPSLQWVGRADYLFPFRNMVLWGMGPALGVTVWVGWAVAGWLLLRRLVAAARGEYGARLLAPLVLWFWVALYFGWQGAQFASTMRYMLPIYGALIVLGAWLLVRIWDWGTSVQRRGPGALKPFPLPLFAARRLAPHAWFPLLRWSLVLVVLATLGWAYAFTRIYTRPHSRIMAAEWLLQQAPPGSRITSELWDDALPLAAAGGDPWRTSYRGVGLAVYAEDDPQKYLGAGENLGILDQLEDADYVTLTSNRVYDSIERLPMRYPVLRRYYHYLFNGELGFELVADITSYPTFLGIPIPDQSAEEAFTVYDHPRILIFKKTPAFTRAHAEELLLDNANWDEVYKLPVRVADQTDTGLRLTTSEWPVYRNGGTWSEDFNPASLVNQGIVAPLLWLLALEVVGLATFALLFRLLPWLPDRGLSLARVLGLLFVAYAAWLLGSLHLLPFSPLSVWLCALPLLVGGGWVAWHTRTELLAFWRARRTALLTAQTIYLVAFLFLLVVRWLNPDLWHPGRGGEKPMDFAYLNAVLQSAAFPPYDPWFAGGYINYYYFGFVIVGTLVHMTTIIPAIAYNLAVPTLFALTALGAWGIVYNLLAPRRTVAHALPPAASGEPGERDGPGERDRPGERQGLLARIGSGAAGVFGLARTATRVAGQEQRARLAALLAPLFVAVLGNLAQAIWFLNGYAAEQQGRNEWAFWDATRIVPGTVNEFPFFTFIFADLHAHMIVIPFSLALLGLLVALVRRTTGGAVLPPLAGRLALLAVLLLLGLLAGTLRATNTWDYPTYVGLTVVTLLLVGWWELRRDWQGQPQRGLLLLRRGLLTVGQIVLVVGVGNLLFQPFTSHFLTESSGVDFLIEGQSSGTLQQIIDAQRTSLWDSIRMYGLWLFLLASAGVALGWRFIRLGSLQDNTALLFGLGLLVGSMGVWLVTAEDISLSSPVLLIPLVLGAGMLAWTLRHLPPRALLPLLWGGTALALILGVEFLVVRGDVGRMNTVFKFGLHAWILSGLAGAVALPWLWRRLRRVPWPLAWTWRGVALMLVAGALIYPLTATPARVADRYASALPQTLDGTQFMRFVDGSESGRRFTLGEDYAAIAWLQENIVGTPVMLEAHLPSYRWGGRIAIYTGLPTLLGWEWHQVQQRMAVQGSSIVSRRQNAVNQIYMAPDAATALDRIQRYGVEYIYVGGLERAIYSPEGLARLAQLDQTGELEPVYTSSSGQTTIYRVVNPGDPQTPTILTSDLAITPPTLRTPPPLMLDQPVGNLPAVGDYAWNSLASTNPWLALLVWLGALWVLGLFGLPLALLLFGHWHDSGIAWARPIGLLLVGYAVWLPASLGTWRYDMWGVVGGALLVVLLNVALIGWMGRTAPGLAAKLRSGLAQMGRLLRARWRGILVSEGLLLVGFLAFVGLRALNPDLWHPVWGGEKPMETGFLNAILRSPVFPPYDPFYSGGSINYYYYGIYLVSLLVRATGIAPAVAFNLIIPTVFALTLAGGYGLVAQITRQMRYGLLGAAFLALLGNLAAVIPAGWSRGLGQVLQLLASGNLADLGERLGDWYIGPSRIIPGTINEFPFWTFLFADLHPHMVALPLALLAIALAYRYLPGRTELDTAPQLPLAWYPLIALTLGALAVTNSWDYPTYTLLVAGVLVGAAWRTSRGLAPGSVAVRLVGAGLLAGALGLAGLVLYAPFFDNFYAMVSGVGLVQETTQIGNYLVIYGIFLAVLLPLIFGLVWRLLALLVRRRVSWPWARWLPPVLSIGLPLLLTLLALVLPGIGLLALLATLALIGAGLLLVRHLAPATWFVLLLALLAWCVSLGVEVIYIQDHLAGGNFYRMNTVFKFGVHIWTLLALAAAAGLPLLLQNLGRIGQRTGIGRWVPQMAALGLVGLLVAAGAVFPLAGIPSRLANRFSTDVAPTLDGLAFLPGARFAYDCTTFGGCLEGEQQVTIDLAPDAGAIAWLNQQVEGTPVVAQSNHWFYRAYGIRIAANTGLPTISSQLHADEQRNPALVQRRNRDVERLFQTSETEETLRLLARYGVEYIYVGPVERALYSAGGLQKFEQMVGTYLERAYTEPGVTIYQVQNIPVAYTGPEPYDFAREDAAIAAEREAERAARANAAAAAPAGVLEEELAPPPEPPTEPAPAPAPATDTAAVGLQALEEQVAADPTNAPLVYGLAERYRTLNRMEDAARVLQVAADANLGDIALHHLWGDILTQIGRYSEAETAYRRAVEADPSAGNWNKLGASLLIWGELERAEEALLRAADANATVPEPYFRLAQVYQMQGRTEEARAQAERYMQLAPDGHFSGEVRTLLQELQ